VASYDQRLDFGVTALQKKTEAFLLKLERTCQTPDGSYEANLAFYEESKVELSALQVRAEAIDFNRLTVQQLALLEASLQDLEAQHKIGLTPIVAAETRRPLNIIFTAILRLELAKKRGKE
jgi:hypothetical protein